MRLDYFETINTQEKAYWLGFLLADGYVGRDGNFVRLILGVVDEDHIDRFIHAVDGDPADKRYYGPYATAGKSVHYSVRSKKMVQDLQVFGCVTKKSLVVRFPILATRELMDACLLGLYDGDGCDNHIVGGSLAMFQDIQAYWGAVYPIREKNISSGNPTYTLNLGRKLYRELLVAYSYSMSRKRLNPKARDKNLNRTCGCGVVISNYATNCLSCAATKDRKSWPSNEELQRLLWEVPSEQIAAMVGVSGRAVLSRARKYGLSKPGPGYWQKKVAGKE